jgi:hypothetical protein
MQKNVMKNLCYAKLGALAFAANFNAKRLQPGVLPGRGTFLLNTFLTKTRSHLIGETVPLTTCVEVQ